MTKGDKIKLRAELAGKAMAALIEVEGRIPKEGITAFKAVKFADALMDHLGISMEDDK